MGYRQITPPSAQPVTLAEAKAQVRVDHSDEDALITRLTAAATSYLDGRTGILGRCLVTQTWELTLDAFPDGEIELPLGPVANVVSVTYVGTAGTTQTLASSNYYFDDASLSQWVVPVADWPDTKDVANAVTVRFIAGTAAASVPEAIRHAILLLIGHWYEQRSTVSVGMTVAEMPMAVDALLAPFRRVFT
jgi:uncharacterized phiE125 gp8 family phage protein